MNDNFESETDFDLNDLFGEDEDTFEEIGDDPDDDVTIRTAVLQKNNMLALLSITRGTAGAAICRVDPRESQPAVQLYDDPSKALEWFTKSLRSSRRNGWTIVYDGLPLQG